MNFEQIDDCWLEFEDLLAELETQVVNLESAFYLINRGLLEDGQRRLSQSNIVLMKSLEDAKKLSFEYSLHLILQSIILFEQLATRIHTLPDKESQDYGFNLLLKTIDGIKLYLKNSGPGRHKKDVSPGIFLFGELNPLLFSEYTELIKEFGGFTKEIPTEALNFLLSFDVLLLMENEPLEKTIFSSLMQEGFYIDVAKKLAMFPLKTESVPFVVIVEDAMIVDDLDIFRQYLEKYKGKIIVVEGERRLFKMDHLRDHLASVFKLPLDYEELKNELYRIKTAYNKVVFQNY